MKRYELPMADDDRYKQALKRAKQLRSFYTTLALYVVVNIAMFLINWATSPGEWWFYWVTIGWGIGMLFYGYSVFFSDRRWGPLSKDWEERKARELMEDDDEA